MPKYLYEYEYGGAKWGFDIWAEDADEARARMRLLPHAKYLGEVMMTITAGGGLLVRAYCLVANAFRFIKRLIRKEEAK